ncbi:MAG: exonuclease SbcCD subunit D [Actinomycetota bacterium]|nr:exonuclease SbcCD subunit D [Actinomycetota bacterium]
MRILHTADWHVGKKLGRIDRSEETERVLAEVVDVARDAEVDLVIVAGDLFDRGLPPFVSLRVVLEKLVDLAETGAHVVAVPGNHDSADLFEVLAPHLEHSRVTLVSAIRRPEDGGVVEIPSRDGNETARVACFPFLHEARAVEVMESHDAKHKSYADRVRSICRTYASYLERDAKKNSVDVLVGHFMIHGAVPSGSERELHIGEAYMASQDAVPHTFHYAALGHIHRPQPAPGSEDYARYAGSLMQLDFGETGQDKSVAVIEVTTSGRRKVEEIPITSGRDLKRVRGTMTELQAMAPDLQEAILAVDVVTDGPSPGIADQVRDFLPDALYVRADYPRSEREGPSREGMSISELYQNYVIERYGSPPSGELTKAFDELVDEVGVSL